MIYGETILIITVVYVPVLKVAVGFLLAAELEVRRNRPPACVAASVGSVDLCAVIKELEFDRGIGYSSYIVRSCSRSGGVILGREGKIGQRSPGAIYFFGLVIQQINLYRIAIPI